jgi:glycosyltransferase involved in cell wall biosynthesis
MVVLEAMALCKPVIGSRIGGIPEQIEDGKTGLLFAMGNATELAERMENLSNNAGLREKMGQAARRKLEQEYSLEDHNRQLLSIYTSLVARAKNRHS